MHIQGVAKRIPLRYFCSLLDNRAQFQSEILPTYSVILAHIMILSPFSQRTVC